MRKFLLALVLPLLLLASQQGRVWHEAQHLGQAATSVAGSKGTKGHKGQPADKLCESCLAFAQLGAVATGGAPSLPPDASSRQADPAPQHIAVAGDVPAPRSRGPPSFH